MSDISIDFAPDGPVASYLLSSTPTRTRGETVSLEIGFDPDTAMGDYRDMVDRLGFVSEVHTGTRDTGVPWVVESLPARAPVASQVLEVAPGSDTAIEGFWGALVGGDDSSRPPRGLRTMTVEMVFLADADEYADRSAVKAGIGATTDLL